MIQPAIINEQNQKENLREFFAEFSSKRDDELVSCKNLEFIKHELRIPGLFPPEEIIQSGSIYSLCKYLDTEIVCEPSNRKYLGSKTRLLDFIETTICSRAGNRFESFFDPFAGTGVVSGCMRQHTEKIIANDLLFSNYIGLKTFLASTREEIDVRQLYQQIRELNTLSPAQGYVYENFGGTYFTFENAAKIDAIRGKIESLFLEKKCSLAGKYGLLTALLYAMDRHANSVGQYDAFLKHIDADAKTSGKHLADANIRKPLILRRPFFFFGDKNEVFNEDANLLAARIKADVVYLDPPYNQRQYIDCYHLLENVMKWEKPHTEGKTRKFFRDHLKSDYSGRLKARPAFSRLIQALSCRHIFLSYNSEGIIDDADILAILSGRGKPEIFENDYVIFGCGAGVAKKRKIVERLFYVKVEN